MRHPSVPSLTVPRRLFTDGLGSWCAVLNHARTTLMSRWLAADRCP